MITAVYTMQYLTNSGNWRDMLDYLPASSYTSEEAIEHFKNYLNYSSADYRIIKRTEEIIEVKENITESKRILTL